MPAPPSHEAMAKLRQASAALHNCIARKKNQGIDYDVAYHECDGPQREQSPIVAMFGHLSDLLHQTIFEIWGFEIELGHIAFICLMVVMCITISVVYIRCRVSRGTVSPTIDQGEEDIGAPVADMV